MNLDLFLHALPEAAKSPAALGAYVITLIVWGGLTFRLSTLNSVKKQLPDLSEAARMELIKTILGEPPPPHLDPDRWIHFKLTRLIIYGIAMLLAVIFVLVAAAFQYLHTQKEVGAPKVAKLALSFFNHEQVEPFLGEDVPPAQKAIKPQNSASFKDYTPTNLTSPIEHQRIIVGEPQSFQDISPDPESPRTEWLPEYGTMAFPMVINLGDAEANDIWFKLYIDDKIEVLPILVAGIVSYGEDKTTGKHICYLTMPNLSLRPGWAYNLLGFLPFHFPPIQRSYVFSYEIGAKGVEVEHRAITLDVSVQNVRPEFVQNALGMEAYNNKNVHLAVDYFKEAIRLNSKVSGFHFNLGVTLLEFYENSDESTNAFAELSAAKQLAPQEPRVLDAFGQAAVHCEQPKIALEIVDALLAAGKRPKFSYSDLVSFYMVKELYSDEVVLCEKVSLRYPRDAGVLNDLAVGYIHIKRLPEAIAALKQSLEIDPANETASHNLAKLNRDAMQQNGLENK